MGRGKRARREKAAAKRRTLILGAVTLAILGVGFALLMTFGLTSDAQLEVQQVAPLDDGTLLVLSHTRVGSRVDSNRLDVVDLSGRVRRSAMEEDGVGTVSLVGIVSGVVFETSGQGLTARELSDLSAVPITSRLASHSILSRGYEVLGYAPERGAVVRGRDRKPYAVAPDGSVSRFEGDYEPTRSMGRVTQDGVPLLSGSEAPPLDAGALDLVQPRVVTSWTTGEPVRFRDPEGLLVVSVDITGPGANARLSRVGSGSTAAWTTPLERAFGASDLDHPAFRCVWAGFVGDRLLAVVQAGTHYAGWDDVGSQGTYDTKILELDPSTGAVRSARRIAGP